MKYIVLLLSLLIIHNVSAQDTLYLTSGVKQVVKVKKIDKKEITYKKLNNIEGPDYVLKKREVVRIVFANGVVEIINEQALIRSDNSNDVYTDFARFSVGYNYGGILFNKISFSLEYILDEKGMFGVKGDFIGGIRNDYLYNGNAIWGTSLALNFYPAGQRELMYFVSPVFQFGEARYTDNNLFAPYRKVINKYFGLYMGQGFKFMPTRNFAISCMLGLGMKHDMYIEPSHLHAIFQANVHFNF